MSTITGTSRNDTLYGTSSADRISGMSGNDILYGGAGNDTILGGAGIDILHGEAGNDSLEGGAGGDTLNGNDGNDTLKGDDGNDTLFGGLGKDYLYGGAGNDYMVANQYTYSNEDVGDYIDGGTGADVMFGGNGNDTYIVDDAGDTVNEREGYGTDTIRSYLQEVTLADNVEIGIFTSSVSHGIMHGNSLDNTLTGNNNSCTLYGEAGNDSLTGGSISDYLYGGSGNDTLQGKQMGDDLYGGTGDDTYIFNVGDGIDTISDEAGNDTISFGNNITHDDIAIFMDSNNSLYIDYSTSDSVHDTIEILNQNTNTIENFIIGNTTISNNTINQIIQDMSAYATENGITISSVEDVKANADLMNLISNALETAA